MDNSSTSLASKLSNSEPTGGQNISHDIFVALMKAFKLMDDMNGSQQNFLDILQFAKDIYCSFKNYSETINKWPKS